MPSLRLNDKLKIISSKATSSWKSSDSARIAIRERFGERRFENCTMSVVLRYLVALSTGHNDCRSRLRTHRAQHKALNVSANFGGGGLETGWAEHGFAGNTSKAMIRWTSFPSSLQPGMVIVETKGGKPNKKRKRKKKGIHQMWMGIVMYTDMAKHRWSPDCTGLCTVYLYSSCTVLYLATSVSKKKQLLYSIHVK